MLHSVYDQADAAAVHAQFDRTSTTMLGHASEGRRPPREPPVPRPWRSPRSPRPVAPDLVEQPAGTAQPRGPPAADFTDLPRAGARRRGHHDGRLRAAEELLIAP